MDNNEIYDLIILGCGPAGIAGAVYANRYNLKTVMVGEIFGGTVMYPHKINNFPSYAEISGIDLINNFKKHIETIDCQVVEDLISKINKRGELFEVYLRGGSKLISKNVLIALGTFRKKLNAKGEDKFLGKGVHYCAICDAIFYKDKNVVVIGSGDGAAMASLLLSETSKKVYQIIRGHELKAAPDKIEQLNKLINYELIVDNEIEEISGDNFVEKIILKNEVNGKKEILVDGVFIEIGGAPNTALINDLNVKVDEKGYIIVDKCMKTSVLNVWAAGDIVNFDDDFKQIINACSQGAIAAHNIYKTMKK